MQFFFVLFFVKAPNRKIQKLMEKDNKKIRDQAKKKRNETVRVLKCINYCFWSVRLFYCYIAGVSKVCTKKRQESDCL